jgi:hypothetical protein
VCFLRAESLRGWKGEKGSVLVGYRLWLLEG